MATVSPAVYVRRSGRADGGLAGGAGTSPARPRQPAYLVERLIKKRRSPKTVYGYGQTCKPCSMLRPPPSSFTGALNYPVRGTHHGVVGTPHEGLPLGGARREQWCSSKVPQSPPSRPFPNLTAELRSARGAH